MFCSRYSSWSETKYFGSCYKYHHSVNDVLWNSNGKYLLDSEHVKAIFKNWKSLKTHTKHSHILHSPDHSLTWPWKLQIRHFPTQTWIYYGLLAVEFSRSLRTFQSCLLPQSWGCKNPEDIHLHTLSRQNHKSYYMSCLFTRTNRNGYTPLWWTQWPVSCSIASAPFSTP